MAKRKPATPKTSVSDDGIHARALECGIVMPISECDGMPVGHWVDVKNIVSEAITDAGLHPSLVSDAADVGIIHKRIIENLYFNPIVVCDVSGKNPNVMFELGLRLAFDKPTVIIKDHVTKYMFDTSPIEHLEYRRDLRFYEMIKFKETLTAKIKATLDRSITDKNFSQFLKAFGEFSIVKLSETEVTTDQFVIQELSEIRSELRRVTAFTQADRNLNPSESRSSKSPFRDSGVSVHIHMISELKRFLKLMPDAERRKPPVDLYGAFVNSSSPQVHRYLTSESSGGERRAVKALLTILGEDYGIFSN